ncbi:hypothetical protein QYE76_027586 [Lolium multiflorum]|uniref:Uncharacterized protein n=1 Tax=Lolium multiflorum TaxID=4521 RepID=A0AAD8QMX7_LOLMU|nr:hypothetical protein QYE76_027586 [Lolium multiflorum]
MARPRHLVVWGPHSPFRLFFAKPFVPKTKPQRVPHELQPPLWGGEHQREKSSPRRAEIRRGNSLREGEIDAIVTVIELDIISITIIIIISTIITAVSTAGHHHRRSNLGDGKLGYGFTSADELEEVDIGPGDKPRPTFSKKLDPHLRSQMIALLKEYPDRFAWDYTEMPGLDRSIIEHRLPLKKGIRPFQQRARQMKAKILEEVKKEIEKMLAAGFIRPCRYAEWISSIAL